MTSSGRVFPSRSVTGGVGEVRSARDHAERAFRPSRRAFLVAGVVLIGAMILGISTGSSDIGVRPLLIEIVDAIPGVHADSGLSDPQRSIIWEWRMPRAVLGALVGLSLAVSGATYQGVFQNPLADPFLLGVAAGAGLGATVAVVTRLDVGWGPFHAVPLLAFFGGLVAIACSAVVGLGASRETASLLLAGVAVASFLAAIQTFLLQRNSDVIAEVYQWLLGRLGTFGWGEVGILGPYVAVCTIVILRFGRQLDVLQLGDDEALALGVAVPRVRIVLIVAASLLASVAVSVSGLIAFVGIIVPHFIRLTVGSTYRTLLPLSAIGGAAFLVLADVGARNLAGGAELPIGVVTAFFGAPFFVAVMWSKKGVFR